MMKDIKLKEKRDDFKENYRPLEWQVDLEPNDLKLVRRSDGH